jgi:adenylate cyclase
MNLIRKILRSSPAAFLFISSCVFLAIVGLRHAGSLESLELAAYDWFMRLGSDPSVQNPHVVMITISEPDIQKQGRWPFPDAALAQALSILLKSEPRAVGLDIFRDISVPPGEEQLNPILAENKHLIGVTKFGPGGVPPPSVLRNTDQVGFNDILVDPGGIVRRALIFMDDGGEVFFSFALRVALLYLEHEGIQPRPGATDPHHLRLGSMTILPFEPHDGGYVRADARGYQFLLDFRGFQGKFRSFSFTDLLSGKIARNALKDKIVLIGVVAQSVKDLFYTPLSRGFHSGQQTTGVQLHALTVSELLRFALLGEAPMRSLGERGEFSWIALWVVIGGAIALLVRSPWRFSICGLCGILALGVVCYLAFLKAYWVPSVPPAMGLLGSAGLMTAYLSNRERRERTLLMQLFSRNVSKDVAEMLWAKRDQFLDEGRPRSQKLTVTVLFSDLRGFTSVSEKMDPQDLMGWLNTYMESMAQLVMRHGGVIDDYAGDGIKANFGVPIPRTHEAEIHRDAMNAVDCALAMEEELHRLNELWGRKHLPPVGIRIGIFTGSAVVGLLGSSERMKYTTMGDTVNTASRLESYDKELAKESPCRILVGESTLRCLNGRFKTEKVGEASLKGKSEKITLFRILGREPIPSTRREEEERT